MASEDQSCGICIFFTEPGRLRLLSAKPGAEGICRRFPPHPIERATQPEVSKADWCGEFKNK